MGIPESHGEDLGNEGRPAGILHRCPQLSTGLLGRTSSGGGTDVAARRNARRFFRLKRRTPTISLSCVRQNRIIEVRDDALVQAVEQMLHGHGYRLAEGIHFRI